RLLLLSAARAFGLHDLDVAAVVEAEDLREVEVLLGLEAARAELAHAAAVLTVAGRPDPAERRLLHALAGLAPVVGDVVAGVAAGVVAARRRRAAAGDVEAVRQLAAVR